ncbi:hypothetical protein KIW84_062684 [Lathyrus oleraceus]|uniref:Uncharacterized protein n=1 Tax=Pisum sativum TaxID=3888 RepID=A0A9D4W6H9_PEA|nr:hypothetical protein KIW84_062684 [Pisum sativum]
MGDTKITNSRDGFSSLKACNASDHSNQNRPEPHGAGVGVTPKEIPETAMSAVGILAFTMYCRRKQKLGSAFDITESRLSTDQTSSFVVISSTLGKFRLFGWSIPMQRSLRVQADAIRKS